MTLRPGSVRVLHDFDKFTQNTDLRIGEVFYLDDRSVGIGRGSSENIVRGCVIDISQCDQALQTGVTLRFLISADLGRRYTETICDCTLGQMILFT